MTFPQRVSHQDPSKKVSKITASGWYHKSIQEERAEKKMKREYNCKQIFK